MLRKGSKRLTNIFAVTISEREQLESTVGEIRDFIFYSAYLRCFMKTHYFYIL